MSSGLYLFRNRADDAAGQAEVDGILAVCKQEKKTFLTLRRQALQRIPSACFLDLPEQLSELDLSWNFLESLPASIWQLTALRRVCLRGNQLVQLWEPAIESSLFCCEKIAPSSSSSSAAVVAAASSSSSSSSTSSSAGGQRAVLGQLEFLDLSENLLVGISPILLLIAPALNTLLLDANKIETLPTLPADATDRCAKLGTFSASNNRLAEFPIGFLASSVGSLHTLSLCDNKFTDIPGSFRFPALTTAQLGNNALGQFPAVVSSLPSLSALSLFRIGMTDLPPIIGQLANLERLDVSFNSLTRVPVAELNQLSKLRHLDLRGNDFDRLDVPDELMARFGENLLIEGDTPDEIVPGVWLGSYNAAKNKFWLKRNNITHILTIAKGLEDVPRQEFTTLTIEIEDLPSEDLRSHFLKCLEFIQGARSAGCGVLVHCVAGVSRSATVVAAFLAHNEQIPANEALSKVKARRPGINPNDGFRRQLEDFVESLLRKPERSRKCAVC